ncbi:MAG: L,D-transpeptidase family protein [Taibaiella sp.]|nr:L,D-transpeptidase family protein [Taibaiella sp.]
MKHLPSALIIITLFTFSSALQLQAQTNPVTTKRVIDSLYAVFNRPGYWSDTGDQLHRAVIKLADESEANGLKKEDYNFPPPAGNDNKFTSVTVSFLKDLYQGKVDKLISNDEVEHAFTGYTDSVVLSVLARSQNEPGLLHSLTPQDSAYQLLSQQLQCFAGKSLSDSAVQLANAANLYRWVKHYGFDKYIVVNIPSATLHLYDYDTVQLQMKVVVGKPSTRTPRFSSWLDKVILYPYWNVPTSIAVKELLPVFKRSPAKVAAMNMQILDKRGRILDPNMLNWQSFHRGNFPYTIRQCTGCDNALGVLKFNLTDPFSVYMHDTNNKPAFMSDYRYLSHGCIRLSDPVALGNALLDNKLDTAFLAACFKNEKPQELKLERPVPVFVIYNTAVVNNGEISYYKDVYHLVR